MNRQQTKNMAQIALFAVVIALCAWICIPTALPLTMQTFGVFLGLRLLGGKKGCAAIGIYLLLGAAGLPVFSGGQGGIGILLGATGGYLLGMMAAALVVWLLEKCCKTPGEKAISMVLGLMTCYGFGTVWYGLLYADGSSLWAVVTACVLPFVVPDLLKIALAMAVARRLEKALQ